MSKPANTLPNPVLTEDPALPDAVANGESAPQQPARVTILNRRNPKPPKVDPDPEPEDSTSSRVERVQDEAEAKLVRDELKEALDFIRTNQFGNAVVEVLRRRQGESEHSYLGELPCSDFSLKTLSEIYGGGNFRLGIKVNGKYVRRVNAAVNQQLRGSHDREIEKQNATPPAPIVPVIAPKDDTLSVILALTEKQAALQRESAERTMQMFAEMNKSNAAMIAAIMTRPEAPAAPPPDNTVTTALIGVLGPILAEMMKPKPNQSLADLVALKQIFTPDPQPEEQMLDKAFRLGTPLLQAVMAGRNQPPMQPAPAPAQAQPEATPGLPATIPALPPGIPLGMRPESIQIAMEIRQYLPMLIQSAATGDSIDGIVWFVNKKLTNEQAIELEVILEREDWRSVLFNDDPSVTTAYRPWFDALRDAFLANDETATA